MIYKNNRNTNATTSKRNTDDINIKNNTSNIIEMNLKSGLYFVNPSASEQNLITIETIENITIQPNSSFSKSITSACTNSSKGMPGGSEGWSKGGSSSQRKLTVLTVAKTLITSLTSV